MAIYKQYVRKPSAFLGSKEEAYREFLLELKNLFEQGKRTVTMETIHFYVRRRSYFLVHNSGMKKEWNEKARRYYFKFWVKRAELAGFIKRLEERTPEGVNINWEITEKIENI